MGGLQEAKVQTPDLEKPWNWLMNSGYCKSTARARIDRLHSHSVICPLACTSPGWHSLQFANTVADPFG